MKILIIGGTRNLGHLLAYQLLDAGHRVTVLNRGKTRDELPERVERLQHIVGWFDHWLMAVPKPEYEITSEEEVPMKPRQSEKPPK